MACSESNHNDYYHRCCCPWHWIWTNLYQLVRPPSSSLECCMHASNSFPLMFGGCFYWGDVNGAAVAIAADVAAHYLWKRSVRWWWLPLMDTSMVFSIRFAPRSIRIKRLNRLNEPWQWDVAGLLACAQHTSMVVRPHLMPASNLGQFIYGKWYTSKFRLND